MRQLLTKFYRSLEAEGLSDRTIGHYTLWLTRWVSHCEQQSIEMIEPDVDDAETWLAQLRRQYGPENVRKALSIVRNFYNWIVQRRHGNMNPFASIKRRGMQPIRVPKGVPTEDEVVRMLHAFDEAKRPADLRDRAIIHVLYGSALRRGELVSLNLTDINWDHGELFLRDTKTKAQAIVPIHKEGLVHLRTYLDIVRPVYSRRSDDHDAQHAVFLGPRGKRVTGDLIAAAVERAAVGAGIERHIHPHLLRHSALTHMRNRGADLRVIQEFARHKSIQATQVYLHLAKGDLRKAYGDYHPAAD